MARDNGSRGFYRHSDATEPTAQNQKQQPTSDKKKPSPKATKDTNDFKYMTGPNYDHLSDHASDLLNARFPPMFSSNPIPPRESQFFPTSGRQRPAYDWKDATIATAFYGSAAVGFGVIMWDGLQAIGGLLVEAGNQLVHESLLRLGY